MGYGRNSFVGWGQETTWGTAVAPTKYAELVADGLRAIRRRDPVPTFRDRDIREGRVYDTLFGGNGGPTIEANYVGMLRLLEHLFGDSSCVTTNPDVGVRYLHTFTLQDTPMTGKGLSLVVNEDTDSGSTPQKRLYGYKINRMTFNFSPERNAQVQIDGAGKDVEQMAVSTPTFPPTTEYVAGYQLTAEFDDVVRAIDSAELSIDNGLDLEKRVMGSKSIAEPVPSDTRRAVTGTINVDAAQADLTKFLAGTLFKLELLNAGAALGTGNYRLDATMLKCEILEDPFFTTGPGIVKASLKFRALKPTSGDLLKIEVHNNESVVA